jgi:hypothetical protein
LAGNDSAVIEILSWRLLEELRKITTNRQNSRLPVRIVTWNLSSHHISLIKFISSVLSLKSQVSDDALERNKQRLITYREV